MRPVTASVPGNVATVFVRPGVRVVRGDILVELTVMGMRQKVAAPINGQVALIWVAPGHDVAIGDVLVELAA